MGGRQDLMRQWLVNKHGEDAIKELESIRFEVAKLDKVTLKEIADKYRKLTNEMLKQKGAKKWW